MLGGLDYKSLQVFVRNALATIGATFGSISTTGTINSAGAKGDLLVGTGLTMAPRAVGADGYRLRPTAANTDGMAWSGPGMAHWNGTLAVSQNGTVLTVAIKTHALADPSNSDPVDIYFRNPTSKTGDSTQRTLIAANSLATTVGGTFGVANSVPFKLWVVAFDDGGTVRLGVINCLTTSAGAGAGRDATVIYPLGQFPVASSTLIGAASSSPGVFYTAGAGVASKTYVVLGYITYESGNVLATAGTFSADPSRLHLQRVGDPLPNQVLQTSRVNDSTLRTLAATILPIDNTIPQSGEGAAIATLDNTITPTSSTNVLEIGVHLAIQRPGVDNVYGVALYQDATANALRGWVTYTDTSGGSNLTQFHGDHAILAGTTAATTFKARAGLSTATALSLNSDLAGAQIFGGVSGSRSLVKEICA
jgi:hypothetical protein